MIKSLQKVKREFFKNGFTKVKKALSKKEIKKILDQIDSIKRESSRINNPNMHFTIDGKLNTLHDINKFVKKGFIIKLSKDRKLVSLVENLLGEKSVVRNIEFFFKPKKTGMKSPVHQDNFYWNITNKKALNVWIACAPSNYKNGGVYYYKNSHKNGLVKHQLSHEAGSSQKIPETYLKKIKYKKYYPNLNVGDCIFHHCEVMHGSKKNNSNIDRIGLVISYKGKNSKTDKKEIKNYRNQLRKNLKFLKSN